MEEPTPARGGEEEVPRAPRLKDLSRLCAELNRLGARYVVVGGFAVIQAGYARFSEIDGVRVPFASPQTLWRMKQTQRGKDVPDRLFLRMLLKSQGHKVEPALPANDPGKALARWIKRLFGR
jgi:hypothetical protein